MASKDLPDVLGDNWLRKIRFSEMDRKFDRSNKTGVDQRDFYKIKTPTFKYYNPEYFDSNREIEKLVKNLVPLPYDEWKKRYKNFHRMQKKIEWKKTCECGEQFTSSQKGRKFCLDCLDKRRKEQYKRSERNHSKLIKENPKYRKIVEELIEQGYKLKDLKELKEKNIIIKNWTHTCKISVQAKKMYYE